MVYDCIVVGAGVAGCVIAGELAGKCNKRVLVIEKRNHIAGNCYDLKDKYGVLIHQYGPHIFHTNIEEVYDYLSQFTKWHEFDHEVVANVDNKQIPVPFNLNTLNMVYGEKKGKKLGTKLIKSYGLESRVPILQLLKNEEPQIRDIANYVYNNIFLKYTMKQWGKKPEEIDPSVTERVPILISYDNRYFQDKYQGIPLKGYTTMFENMLDSSGVEVKLHTDAKDVITIMGNQVKVMGKVFDGEIIYTGALDELFQYEYGRLPYRSLDFVFEHYDVDDYQGHGVVNYTVSEEYTRITEFKHLTGQKLRNGTTIVKEYPFAYQGREGEVPYYAIANTENEALYKKYYQKLGDLKNFHLLGRLAEYKYYNIDIMVQKALLMARQISSN